MYGTIYSASSMFEMFIVIERLFSTRHPHVYHESGRATMLMLLATIFAYAFGCCSGYLLFIRGPRALGLFLNNLIDFLILIINGIGISYSGSRFNALYGKATLNARYQVRSISFLLKV
ncbi:hypothetical protein PMAYCL1PPCAC_15442 [Pristionchus mayeri]|uniref:G protein-coupled receptor n=1 Tax=Pristionchus mayeri TaxID=1317129 RepID=A0AAN5CIX5_9BILA|nr:hypothetical protein PMAYCL1PPCAC_15442 [Pristionchus mayeri]